MTVRFEKKLLATAMLLFLGGFAYLSLQQTGRSLSPQTWLCEDFNMPQTCLRHVGDDIIICLLGPLRSDGHLWSQTGRSMGYMEEAGINNGRVDGFTSDVIIINRIINQ